MWARAQQFVEDNLTPYVPTSVSTAFAQLAPEPLPPVEPFPPLPFELVLRILSFTLPPPSYTHAHARAKRLKRLALLNKDTARWAVLKLRTHVALSSFDAARWFVMTARKKGPTWAGAVRSLRLGSAEQVKGPAEQREAVDRMWRAEGSSKLLRDLLNTCENVDELWVSGISGVEVDHFGEGKNLRKLYITETRIVPSSAPPATPLILPHLHSLYLKSVIFTGPSLSTFLAPTSLPSLRTLDYLSVHRSLVTPLVHPRARPQAGPMLLGGGGPPGLASITASLAALSGPFPAAASVTPSSSSASGASSDLAASHPILSLSSQLTHLSIGPHATRTLPLSLLTNGGLALLFPSLTTLSIPRLLLGPEHLEPADFPSGLRALRLTGEPQLWRLDEESGGYPAARTNPAIAKAEQDEGDFRRECAINVFGHQAMNSSFPAQYGAREERLRVVTVPRLSAASRFALRGGFDGEGTTVGEDDNDARDIITLDNRFLPAPSSPFTSLAKSAAADPSPFPSGGFPLLVVEEDQGLLEQWPRRDGVWELGGERWRERAERGREGWAIGIAIEGGE